ncbi:response regulator [Desulfococcaceae bacterium HSG7]|nr:response regulator [Desulfococcaceae bacterium HSG7]
MKKNVKVKFTSGLGRTLSISFLLFALIPMTLIGVIGDHKAFNSLDREIKKGLENAVTLKTREISAYFDSMLAQLRFQSETDANTKLLEELVRAYKASSKPLAEFVKSYKWTMIEHDLAGSLRVFRKAYNYHDIFLISQKGDIIYTIKGEADLGTNLFTGAYRSTKLADACRMSLETGKLGFSDYERHAPSGGLVFGFITAPVVNEDGDRIGAIAFQFPIDSINRIMQAEFKLGKTAEIYMVGPDLTLRSGLKQDKGKALIREEIRTEQTMNIKQDLNGGEIDHIALTYQGPHGKQVLGLHQEFRIENIVFAVIAEIEYKEAFAAVSGMRSIMLFMIGLTIAAVVVFVVIVVRRIVRPVLLLVSGTEKVARGDFAQLVEIKVANEIGDLARSFHGMIDSLRSARDKSAAQDQLKAGIKKLNDVMRGEKDVSTLCRDIVTCLAEHLNARIGAIFLTDENRHLKIAGRYAYEKCEGTPDEFAFGQGVIGQAAADGKIALITDAPDDYITVTSGLGKTPPRNIVALPFQFEKKVKGVIELGVLDEFTDLQLKMMEQAAESIGIAINAAQSRARLKSLLDTTRVQQNKLESANEELEAHTLRLRQSEEQLKAQEEELRVANDTLSERNDLLKIQKNEVEKARNKINNKAEELAQISKYKSEFLANMSHELRTPLNSIMLLSGMIAKDQEEKSDKEHRQMAQVINDAGADLLQLINEVLDLAKIEAGKMPINIKKVKLEYFVRQAFKMFNHTAVERRLEFNTNIEKGLPDDLNTDQDRVQQVIRNFLSNAFKFTEKGAVSLLIHRLDAETADHIINISAHRDTVKNNPEKYIAISVKDTGFGIPQDKIGMVFEAFQQVDGTSKRAKSGTGLGLSISREIADILKGALALRTQKEIGSSFSLILPLKASATLENQDRQQEPPSRTMEPRESATVSAPLEPAHPKPDDDRFDISKTDKRVLLIVEDDTRFAKILIEMGRQNNFKVIASVSGSEGVRMAEQYLPAAILLDIKLPVMNGWDVLRVLKKNPATRHIPIHIMSILDEPQFAYKMGAAQYLVKPVKPEDLTHAFAFIEEHLKTEIRKLLVVEDNDIEREAIIKLIGNGDVEITGVADGRSALQAIKTGKYHAMVLDLKLPDMNGYDVLTNIKENPDIQNIPVIIYTGKDLSIQEERKLRAYAESIILKTAESPARLLEETAIFLHRVQSKMDKRAQAILAELSGSDEFFKDKTVLVADDDIRNTYALSAALRNKGLNVITAANGKDALDTLNQNPDVNIVLMDIMMPVMDGYEATRRIRDQERFANLPVICITAKALKEDREKCIQAGASDYLTKPVDYDQLFSLLRVWLSVKREV